jgi:ABC-2 type transport system permease protein
MLINHVDLLETALWLPLILAEVYLFSLGVSLFLAAAFVKYRDFNYIWEVVLQAGFYMAPILYPLSIIANLTLRKLIMLNPMAQTMQDARYALVTHQTVTIYQVFDGGWYSTIPFITVAVVLAGGLIYFRKRSVYFAENI